MKFIYSSLVLSVALSSAVLVTSGCGKSTRLDSPAKAPAAATAVAPTSDREKALAVNADLQKQIDAKEKEVDAKEMALGKVPVKSGKIGLDSAQGTNFLKYLMSSSVKGCLL